MNGPSTHRLRVLIRLLSETLDADSDDEKRARECMALVTADRDEWEAKYIKTSQELATLKIDLEQARAALRRGEP